MATEIRIIDADTLKVGPDDRLLIRVHENPLTRDEDERAAEADDYMRALLELLETLGLGGRVLVVRGNIEWALIHDARHE